MPKICLFYIFEIAAERNVKRIFSLFRSHCLSTGDPYISIPEISFFLQNTFSREEYINITTQFCALHSNHRSLNFDIRLKTDNQEIKIARTSPCVESFAITHRFCISLFK